MKGELWLPFHSRLEERGIEMNHSCLQLLEMLPNCYATPHLVSAIPKKKSLYLTHKNKTEINPGISQPLNLLNVRVWSAIL